MFSRSGSETRASEASNPALVDFFDCVSEEWQERQKDLDFQIFEDNLSVENFAFRYNASLQNVKMSNSGSSVRDSILMF